MQQTISPVDGRVYVERPLATSGEVDRLLDRGLAAWQGWRRTPLAERQRLVLAAVAAFEAKAEQHAEELAWQIGRPIRYGKGEVAGFADRARTLVRLSDSALAPLAIPEKPGFVRALRREPLGLVLVLSPWNYPFLTAVNAVVPALLAGNAVLLKHSDQTPLAAERMVEAFLAAGLPEGVFQFVHMTHELTAGVVADPRVAHVAFTGSVEGGRAVHRAAAGTFKTVALELGGKDPAYVRADADLDFAIENVVDGAFFNSGQSCCAVERVYVHADVYDRFVEGFAELTRKYVLDDPTRTDTTLGPVVRERAAAGIRAQVQEAVSRGARALIDPASFARDGGAYVAPQVLVGVNHGMTLMREETFGPAVGIMPVRSDEEAIALMNDSRYGLTASIWTKDLDAAAQIGDQLETGTVFANRCDYLDPELAWVGVKDSGRGCTLSVIGFESFTRPKSTHFRSL